MRTHPSRSRGLGAALIAVALGLGALAVLGPLVTDVIGWRIRPLVRDQLFGLDAVSLALVAPVALAGAVLALRGSRWAPLLGLPVGAYAVYMVPQYVLGPDYSHLPGDNERFFPLLLLLFVAGILCSALSWIALAGTEPAEPSRTERLVGRWLLPAAAVLLFVRYVPVIADWTSAKPDADDYVAGPGFAWTIALLDLGLALPATAAVCVGYRRSAAWARSSLYVLTGWYALVGTAVAGMAVAMQLRDNPAMTIGQMVTMTVLGAALFTLAAVLHVPLWRRSHPPSAPRDRRWSAASHA